MAWLKGLGKLIALKWLFCFYEYSKILSILAPKFVTVAKKSHLWEWVLWKKYGTFKT